MEQAGPLFARTYGNSGPWVVTLHGGPAAAGGAAPIAEGLAGQFRALEPWQRPSGGAPLTVHTHIADLHAAILERCTAPIAIVGESWGAMLALAYAAAHPGSAAAIVLIGCGTFDPIARARLQETLAARDRASDPAPYDYVPILPESETRSRITFDKLAYEETWADMIRLQDDGTYPAAFAAITSPVLMIHGDHDPHPGAMTRDTLLPFIPHLEYVQLDRCGHSPWNERHARALFFETLHSWLERRLSGERTTASE